LSKCGSAHADHPDLPEIVVVNDAHSRTAMGEEITTTLTPRKLAMTGKMPFTVLQNAIFAHPTEGGIRASRAVEATLFPELLRVGHLQLHLLLLQRD
jgi:hypothetical protein